MCYLLSGHPLQFCVSDYVRTRGCKHNEFLDKERLRILKTVRRRSWGRVQAQGKKWGSSHESSQKEVLQGT